VSKNLQDEFSFPVVQHLSLYHCKDSAVWSRSSSS